MKLKVWLDSGANVHSRYETTCDTETEFSLSDDEWNALTEEQRDELVRDVAFERADWGYAPADE